MSEWRETDFGKIPNHWELKKVIDIKSNDKRAIAMGPFGSNIKAENFVEYGVPVIRGTNLNYAKYVDGEFVFLTEKKADELIGSNCKSGDLVFTHRGTIGQVGLVPSKFPRYVISQSGMKLSVNSDLIDNEFLFYFFKSEFGQFQILKYESQVGVPSISNPLTSLKEIEVPVPPLPEQKSIASILSCLDDKIDLLHRQNATLEKIAETLFRQWFVEEAMEDWEEGKLSDLVFVKYGKDHKKLLDGKIPVFGSGGLMRYAEKSLYDKESVLIPRKGTLSNVMYQDEPFWTVDTMFYTEMKVPNVAKFVYHFLKDQDLASMNVGSAVPSMTTEILNNMPLDTPPKEVFEKFEGAVAPLYAKTKSNQNQIRTLTALRDTLLQKLMSGGVLVKTC
jgi:type I restriction enzyme S subunit